MELLRCADGEEKREIDGIQKTEGENTRERYGALRINILRLLRN
jgi:hypothetical protein